MTKPYEALATTKSQEETSTLTKDNPLLIRLVGAFEGMHGILWHDATISTRTCWIDAYRLGFKAGVGKTSMPYSSKGGSSNG